MALFFWWYHIKLVPYPSYFRSLCTIILRMHLLKLNLFQRHHVVIWSVLPVSVVISYRMFIAVGVLCQCSYGGLSYGIQMFLSSFSEVSFTYEGLNQFV